MTTTGAETGIVKSVVDALLKPFGIIANPIAERIATWFKRKPRIYANFHPVGCLWGNRQARRRAVNAGEVIR